jgi:hypothetical protein
MDKESIFLSCIIILTIFEIGYYLITPSAIWSLELGAISSVIVIGISVGLVAGLNIAASGENGFGARLIFISATLFCILFQFTIPQSVADVSGPNTLSNTLAGLGFSGYKFTSTSPIPVGIGLFYPNMTNIFINGLTDPLSIFGLIIMSTLMFITLITGLMIAAGEHG